jgi:hypothetical protein
VHFVGIFYIFSDRLVSLSTLHTINIYVFLPKINLAMWWSVNFAELNILRTSYALLLMNWVVRYAAVQEHKNEVDSCRE